MIRLATLLFIVSMMVYPPLITQTDQWGTTMLATDTFILEPNDPRMLYVDITMAQASWLVVAEIRLYSPITILSVSSNAECEQYSDPYTPVQPMVCRFYDVVPGQQLHMYARLDRPIDLIFSDCRLLHAGIPVAISVSGSEQLKSTVWQPYQSCYRQLIPVMYGP